MKRTRQNIKQVTVYDGKTVEILDSCVLVDPEKFRAIVEKKGMIVPDMSADMGYARGTLTTSLKGGYLSKSMVTLLKSLYGITQEEYEYKPEEVKREEPATVQQTEMKQPETTNPNELYQTVKMAVLDAINEALAGNMKNLRGMIFTAITQAKQ